MTSTKALPVQPGIVLTTSIAAGGGISLNHAEGILVATAITAGGDAIASNHAEGILAFTAPQAMRGE
jgi:hypothetical protein